MATNAEQQKTDLFTVIRERQSIRSYDPSWKISEQEIKEMIGEAVLAPSSSNLQPWRFLVVQDQTQKEKLLPIANGQKQIVEASATIVLLGDLEAYKQADKIYSHAVEAGMPEEFKNSYLPRIVEFYSKLNPEAARGIALVDGGLVAMQFMLVAKARGYDTVPIGGFSAEQLIKEFNIPAQYVPVMLISVGKATAPGFVKSRLSVDEVTFWNRLE